MSSRSRESRRESARARERSSTGRRLVPLLAAAIVVIAAVAALALSGTPAATPGSTVPPSSAASGADPSASAPDGGVGAPVISGAALPTFESPVDDPAIGQPAPIVEGASFDGSPTGIAADGRAKVVIFLAHWCSHCQAEVPLLQAWVSSGGVPDGVDLVSVVTAIDPDRPNHPPAAWLEREGWTSPVIVDPENTVAAAYGLSAFPFWTFIAADGTVHARAAGQLDIQRLSTVVAGLAGS